MKKFKEFRTWSNESVREACVNNNFYTRGNNEEYSHMLSWVERLYPNTENIQFIAENILEHSEDQTLSNIMFVLVNRAVTISYEEA